MKTKNIQSVSHSVSPVAEKLLVASKMEADKLLKQYSTTLSGYSEETAKELINKYGKNEISHEKTEPVYKRLIGAFVNPFTIVLFILATISLVTDVLIAVPSDKDPSTVIIICTMVLISGLLRFVQETRSNNSAEKLKAMVNTTTTVSRGDEGKKEVPLADIVPGDIIYLSAGDMIPADVRVIACKDLFVSQSSLTGESEPLEKYDHFLNQDSRNPLELSNLAFMGSNVVSGSATCIVLATGDYTCFGSMAKTITDKQIVTSFEKGINSVSWVLIRFMGHLSDTPYRYTVFL